MKRIRQSIKRNKKKILPVVVGVVLAVMTTGCDIEKTIEDEYKIDASDVTDYRDPETGVHYLIFNKTSAFNGGMTVRYNSDGTIMVTDLNESEE